MSLEDKELVMMTFDKETWRNLLKLTQIGNFRDVPHFFQYAARITSTVMTLAAFGINKTYLLNSERETGYEIDLTDDLAHVKEQFYDLVNEMGVDLNQHDILDIFDMLGGELEPRFEPRQLEDK